MLTLPIKKKWFDMILSGKKKEEYREIKPYYETRFTNLFGVIFYGRTFVKRLETGSSGCAKDDMQAIRFRNGYCKNSPSFVARCTLSIGTGKEKWGAEKGKEYFILTVRKILKESERDTEC